MGGSENTRLVDAAGVARIVHRIVRCGVPEIGSSPAETRVARAGVQLEARSGSRRVCVLFGILRGRHQAGGFDDSLSDGIARVCVDSILVEALFSRAVYTEQVFRNRPDPG